MKSEKECQLVYTCDDRILLYSIPPFNENEGICTDVKVHVNVKAHKVSAKMIDDETIELKYKKKGMVFSSTNKQVCKLEKPSCFEAIEASLK